MQVHLKINIIPIPTLRQLASYEQVSYHHELFYEMSTELFLLIIRDERNIIFTLNILRIKWYYVIRGDPIVIRVETWSFLQDPSVQPLRQYYLYLEFKHGKSPLSMGSSNRHLSSPSGWGSCLVRLSSYQGL